MSPLKYRQFYPSIQAKFIKWFTDKLNPFKLCPNSLTYWFLTYPYNAIGISINNLNHITITWRQQLEPNETTYVNFNILEFVPPFPITLLVLFSALGLCLSDAANRVLEEVQETAENAPSSLDPFRLTPRLSIFFPVNEYTSIGFLTIDFRHIEFSVAQALEPNNNIQLFFRFLDLYSPFPVQITALCLSLGLFINGIIYQYEQGVREDTFGEVKGSRR